MHLRQSYLLLVPMARWVAVQDGCLCDMSYFPVCGQYEDGEQHTFSNAFECDPDAVHLLHTGECAEDPIVSCECYEIYHPVCAPVGRNRTWPVFENDCWAECRRERNHV